MDFKTWEAAHAAAIQRARETGCDVGLERNDLFKTFTIFLLPKPQNRTGHELRCEVVQPTDAI